MRIFTAESAAYAETVFDSAHEAAVMSNVMQFLALPAGAAPPAAAAAAPSSTALNTLLNSVAQSPGATSVVTVPSAPVSGDAALLQNVQTLDSYIAVLTALVMYDKHPVPYDLTDRVQRAQFTIDLANARNFVVTGGVVKAIPMYLPMGEASTQAFKKTVTTADLHIELLSAMFGAFDLPATVFKQLDAVLTEVAGSLRNVKLSAEVQTQTFDKFVTFYHLVPFEGADPPVNQMKVEFIFMQMAQSSWEASVAKSTVSHFSLDFSLTHTSATMNSGIVCANAGAIVSSLMQLTGNDAAAISQMTQMRAVRT